MCSYRPRRCFSSHIRCETFKDATISPHRVTKIPAFKKSENKSIIMDIVVYNLVNIIDSHVTFRQQNWTKNGNKNGAKTKNIIILFESIVMDFIISRKSHYMDFFPLYFCFARCAKSHKN